MDYNICGTCGKPKWLEGTYSDVPPQLCECGIKVSEELPKDIVVNTPDKTIREILEEQFGETLTDLGLARVSIDGLVDQAEKEIKELIAKDYIHKDKLLSVEEIGNINCEETCGHGIHKRKVGQGIAQAIYQAQQEKRKGVK